MAQELKDITDQLGEGGRSVHELQKIRRRLELEKDELQQALEEAEGALEAEETKLLRAQVEISQIKSEIEKRLAEKEEEFENTRRNHQRALESLQASLETESRGRAEMLRVKKKLESDINELEIGLDQANRANADAQRNLRSYQETVRDLQLQVEDEQRQKATINDQLITADRKMMILSTEKDELVHSFEQAERARRQAELERAEVQENLNALSDANSSLAAIRRKYESEIQQIQTELSDAHNELAAHSEQARKAGADASRLAEELRAEQEHSQNTERANKNYELQLKDLQARLDEAESLGVKGGKKQLAKLENRVHELEQELDQETRRHAETQKNQRTKERRCRELQFQVDEDKKGQERLYELVEKLQLKIKTYKRQVEEAVRKISRFLEFLAQKTFMLSECHY